MVATAGFYGAIRRSFPDSSSADDLAGARRYS